MKNIFIQRWSFISPRQTYTKPLPTTKPTKTVILYYQWHTILCSFNSSLSVLSIIFYSIPPGNANFSAEIALEVEQKFPSKNLSISSWSNLISFSSGKIVDFSWKWLLSKIFTCMIYFQVINGDWLKKVPKMWQIKDLVDEHWNFKFLVVLSIKIPDLHDFAH